MTAHNAIVAIVRAIDLQIVHRKSVESSVRCRPATSMSNKDLCNVCSCCCSSAWLSHDGNNKTQYAAFQRNIH
eukprot:3082735-Amphidinium_carterae.1